MAKSYRLVDRDQQFLLPPDMRQWLPGDHLVWFLIAAVERMDTSAFDAKAKLGGVGRRGYDPQMLLTLFIYAMAQGESSSRRIERLCHTDVAFRVICAQDVPDHTVLARFRQKHQEALTGMLTESLVLAAELGMVSLGVVALDGTKIAANASKDANRGEARLRELAEDYLTQVGATDAAEDALFGLDHRGDELPRAVGDRTDRPGRIDRALAQIAARRDRSRARQQERAREYENAAADGATKPGKAPQGVDWVQVTRTRWERLRAQAAARYEAYQVDVAAGVSRNGRPPLHPDENSKVRRAWQEYQEALAGDAAKTADVPTGAGAGRGPDERSGRQRATTEQKTQAGTPGQACANVTDPDSRLQKTRNGWIQGMNCQTCTSEDVFILGARATQDTNDMGQFLPTKDELEATMTQVAARTGRADLGQIGTMIADAGYDTQENLTAPGPDRLIADSKGRHIEARAAADPAAGAPPDKATARARMNHRLRTPEGLGLYRRRSHMVETPNAWLKDRRGLRQFARRGLEAVQAELSLAAAVTNLLRLAAKGVSTAHIQGA